MNYKTLTIAIVGCCLSMSSFALAKIERKDPELSPESIARWVTSWEDPKFHKKYTFSTHFTSVHMRDHEKKKHKRNGTIPFRITGDLIQSKEKRGRMLHKRETGSVVIVIRAVDGKQILSKKVSLTKFCPS